MMFLSKRNIFIEVTKIFIIEGELGSDFSLTEYNFKQTQAFAS